MVSLPASITADNFSKVWKYSARKFYWSKKKAVIRKVSVPVSQLLYFFLFIIFSYGAAYSMIPGTVHRYILKLPVLVSLWTDFESLFFASAATETHRLILTAGALYLLPFCAGILSALLICLLYHPRTPRQTGEPAQDAVEMWGMAKHAQIYAKQKEPNTASDCAAFAGMLIAVAVLGYLLYGLTLPGLKQQIVSEAHTANMRLFVYAAALFFSFKLLNIPLHLLLKMLHICHIPKKLLSVTEAYCHSLQASSAEDVASNS